MKFLDTNLTMDQVISGLLKTKDNLPQVLNEWSSLDEQLRVEYLDQLIWLLDKSAEFMNQQKQYDFWCEGCGEPRYKCYCNEDCPFCTKKLKDCSSQSESGYCDNDTRLHILELKKRFLSGNKE